MEKDIKKEELKGKVEEMTKEDIGELKKEYLIIKGKFNYGGRNKTYGILIGIFDTDTREFIKLDLLEKDLNIELELETNLASTVEFFKRELDNYRSKKRAEKLVSTLNHEAIEEIFQAAEEDDEEKLIKIFKERLEDLIQESLRFEVSKELISQEDLEEVYPELFREAEEETEEEAENESLEEVNDSLQEEEHGLDAELELKCSPIISAIQGRRITDLESGDKLLVKITDNRELGQDLRELLEQHNGAAVGTIDKVDYNQELDRYRVLIKFKRNIYGRLVADPELKLAVFTEKNNEQESSSEVSTGFNLDQDILILFGAIGTIVVLSIIIFLML